MKWINRCNICIQIHTNNLIWKSQKWTRIVILNVNIPQRKIDPKWCIYEINEATLNAWYCHTWPKLTNSTKIYSASPDHFGATSSIIVSHPSSTFICRIYWIHPSHIGLGSYVGGKLWMKCGLEESCNKILVPSAWLGTSQK